MNYCYLRYSTDSQDERQQKHTVEEYCASRKIQIDQYEMDEGVSGKIPYKERKLYGLIQQMKPGDTLIVSELSRLGRNMCDLHKLISEDLKSRGIRLIVIKAGVDIHCGMMRAVDEMVLQSFAFSAQLEREMISERTKSALAARKKSGRDVGGTNALWGSKKGTKSSRREMILKAAATSVKSRREAAKCSQANLAFRDFMAYWESSHGPVGESSSWGDVAKALNERGIRSSKGLMFSPPSARSAWVRMKTYFGQ